VISQRQIRFAVMVHRLARRASAPRLTWRLNFVHSLSVMLLMSSRQCMQLPLGCLSGTVVRMWYGSQLVNAVRLDMSGNEQSWEESISWRTHSGVETTLMCSCKYVFVRIGTYLYVLRTYLYVSVRIRMYCDTFFAFCSASRTASMPTIMAWP